MDVRFYHHSVHPQLAPAGDFQRLGQLDDTVVKSCNRLGTYLVLANRMSVVSSGAL